MKPRPVYVFGLGLLDDRSDGLWKTVVDGTKLSNPLTPQVDTS